MPLHLRWCWLALTLAGLILSGCRSAGVARTPGDSTATVESPGPAVQPIIPSPVPSVVPTVPGWHRQTLGGGGGQTGIAIHPTDSNIVYVTTDNGGIIKSVDSGETWFSINNNIGNGRLGDIAMDPLDPEVLYVTAKVYSERREWRDAPVTGELYRTRNGGRSWEVAYAEGMGTGDGRCFGIIQWPSTRNILISFLPSDPGRYDADGDHLTDVIYVGGWDEDEASADQRAGVWKSTDEGATFTQLALNDKNIWVLRQEPDDPEVLYAGTFGDGLWVSRDGGATWADWRSRIPMPMISDIAMVPGSDVLYVATNTFYSPYSSDEYRGRRGVYKSVDGGESFFAVNAGLERTSLNFEVLALDSTDPSGQTLYTGPWSGPDRGIYKTSDGGAHWTRMSHETADDPPWFQRFDNLWALEQARDGTLFATSWRGIYRYDPARQHWAIKANGLGNISVQEIAFEPWSDTTIYLGILDSTPWKSTDRGVTWTSIGDGFTTTDGGERVGASDFAISPTDPRVVYATGIGSSGEYVSAVNRSEDRGQHWTTITNGLRATSTEDPQWQANAIAVSVHNPNVAYVVLEMKEGGGRIYKTANGGQEWQEILAFSERPTDLALSTTDPETLVCVTRQGTVYISADAGREWHSSKVDEELLYAVDVFSTDPSRILVGANVSGAYLTTDGGQTWQHIFSEAELTPLIGNLALSSFARERYWPTIRAVMFDPRDPETLYLGHNPNPWLGVGVLKSVDGGRRWTVLDDRNFQMRSVSSLDLDSTTGNLVAGTWEAYYYHIGQR